MEFKDKSVIVTGASRGLGFGLVIGLLRRGARVVGVARDSKALDTAFASLRADKATVWALSADVRNPDAATRIVGYANAVLGRIDALFNNASTLGPVPMEELNDASDADWLDVLQANLLGPVRLTRAALPSLTRHGEGLVVNVSSDAARNAYPTWGLYSASKAALDHTTAVWRAEQEQAGVCLTAVDPGEMNTRMHEDAIPDADPASLRDPNAVAEAILQRLERGEAPARWEVSL